MTYTNQYADRVQFMEEFREMLRKWGVSLAALEDDIERNVGDARGDYEELIQKLARQYRSLELRADEVSKMNAKKYAEIRTILEEEIQMFVSDLNSARDFIEDI